MPAWKVCVGCKKPIPPTKRGRCQQCKRESPTWRAGNVRAERRRRADTVAAWVAVNGYWCPGYGMPAHPSTDLTADHVTAVANGGADGALAVLCRPCNSRKSNR